MTSHIVMIAIVEGRYFAKKPDCKTYIQCRMNQEIMSSDPCSLTETPIWDVELCWAIDQKSLLFYRTQRVPIKVVCYSIDASNVRETMGYVMLDLRTAPNTFPPPEKWYPLVSTKPANSRYRPEIKLGFTVGPKEAMEKMSEPRIESNHQPKSTQSLLPSSSTNSLLKIDTQKTSATLPTMTSKEFSIPFKLLDDGYFQIGEGTDLYTLSITISFAEQLHLLSKSTRKSEYFFRFTFLDNQVSTELFTNLYDADFSAEKLSIHFSSSLEELMVFLGEFSELTLDLCQKGLNEKDILIGYIRIPLGPVIKPSNTAISSPTVMGQLQNGHIPFVFEKQFKVLSSQHELITKNSKSPSVGISIQMAREGEEKSIGNISPPSSPMSSPKSPKRIVSETSEKTLNSLENQLKGSTHALLESIHHLAAENAISSAQLESPITPIHIETENEKFDQEKVGMVEKTVISAKEAQLEKPISLETTNKTLIDERREDDLIFHKEKVRSEARVMNDIPKDQVVWHQFRFSVDLKSIREVKLSSANIFVRYLYRSFGSMSPFISHPPVSVKKSLSLTQDFNFQKGFCAYEIVMNYHDLTEILNNDPIAIEVWHKDDFEKDQFIGNSSLKLSHVLQVKKAIYHDDVRNQEVEIRTIQITLPVVGIKQQVVMMLDVILVLEDFGIVNDYEDDISNADQRELIGQYGKGANLIGSPKEGIKLIGSSPETESFKKEKKEKKDPYLEIPKAFKVANSSISQFEKKTEMQPIHSSLEYQAVLDLELWKKQEQIKFEKQMQEKEEQVLGQLVHIYKQKELQRQKELSTKMQELDRVQEQVVKLTTLLNEREEAILEKEIEFGRQKSDLERDYQQLGEDLKTANKRLQEEYAHHLQVEKKKVLEADKSRMDLIKERDGLNKRIASLEENVFELKRNSKIGLDIELKAEINSLKDDLKKQEKENLEMAKKKKSYKEQVIKLLKEVTKLRKLLSKNGVYKDSVQTNAQLQLSDIQQDKKLLSAVMTEFEAFKSSLLHTNEEVTANYANINSSPIRKPIRQPPDTSILAKEKLDASTLAQLEKWISQRDQFIESGQYTWQDPLVKELTCRIREIIPE